MTGNLHGFPRFGLNRRLSTFARKSLSTSMHNAMNRSDAQVIDVGNDPYGVSKKDYTSNLGVPTGRAKATTGAAHAPAPCP